MKTIAITIITLLLLSGCTTPSQRGAIGGSAMGAAAGQIIGGDTEATLIGAGLGALGGALANDYIDQQKRDAYQHGYNTGYQKPVNTQTRSGYTQRITVQPDPIVVQPPPVEYDIDIRQR